MCVCMYVCVPRVLPPFSSTPLLLPLRLHVRWRPDLSSYVLQRLDSEIPASQRGDMLVFVAGMADIVALAEAIRPYAMESRRWVRGGALMMMVWHCSDGGGALMVVVL